MSQTQGTQYRAKLTQQEQLIGGTLRNGEYKIEALLGQGGMGRVFLATHITLQIPVAIKQGLADKPIPEAIITELDRLLHSENALRRTSTSRLSGLDLPLTGGEHTDRFLREALLLANLQHASLPAIYDYFIEEGYWYLVMDYIPGPTLSTYIQQHAPLAPLEALNYAIQLCDVLEYLHKQSPPIIFRDLKPSNIILSPDGRVMLVDFGIARYFKAGQLSDTVELGSPGYAPPEQYKGEGQTDGRSDLYSLGVILHEMLSGKHPPGPGEKLGSLYVINPAISSVLSGLVSIATRSEPTYRFQSAHTLYLALERAYTIEERRAYQRGISAAETHEPSQWSALQIFPSAQDTHAAFQLTVQLAQRQQVRAALQEAHREHIEQNRAETRLLSLDESPHQHSSRDFTPMPFPPISSEELVEEAFPPLRSFSIGQHIPRAIFGLALLVFVIMASINVYGFFLHPRPQILQASIDPSPPSRPTARPTATMLANDVGVWQTLPSMPSPEADNAAAYVQVHGKAYIYISGGFRGFKAAPRYDHNLYRYDIAAAHWQILASENFPGMVNNAVALDEQGHLFFTAGYSSDVYALTSLLYMYEPFSGRLQKIVPSPPVSLGYSAMVIADQHGHLYITQGFTHAGDPHTLAGFFC
ncbi:MAG: protein kinase domain-containing protein [Ktedonobacteraceae bacterium]